MWDNIWTFSHAAVDNKLVCFAFFDQSMLVWFLPDHLMVSSMLVVKGKQKQLNTHNTKTFRPVSFCRISIILSIQALTFNNPQGLAVSPASSGLQETWSGQIPDAVLSVFIWEPQSIFTNTLIITYTEEHGPHFAMGKTWSSKAKWQILGV